MAAITASLTAENTYSDSVTIVKGKFNFSLSGTWVATVYVQRSFDNGSNWLDVDSFTTNCQMIGEETEYCGCLYRFGIKTGGYTNGTVIGRISQ